ncbi:acetyl-CoA C-acyltransferase [Thermoflexus hugenholtzii]
MREAVIVAGVRTAVGKAKKGTLRTTRPEALAAAAIAEALRRAPGVEPAMVDDVILGCAMPEGHQGLNIARIAALKAGLPVSVPAMTINRFCSSGLQAIALAAERIMTGGAEIIIAGGVESMSLVPMVGFTLRPDPELAVAWPEVFISMGLGTERLAERFGISREDADAFSLRSHQRAIAAIDAGKFKEEIVPLEVEVAEPGEDGRVVRRKVIFEVDEGPRRDTSMEALAKLPPAFKNGGVVTAGNSSQMSDGAAAVVVMERRRAEALGLRPIARFVSFAVAGVPPDLFGIGPVEAIPKALRMAGLRLEDIDLIELNEAFAAQALAVIRQLEMDVERVNVNGGAIALGHPLGCTGAKLTVQILHELRRRGGRYGMVTMCIGGGMGAAGIFEML